MHRKLTINKLSKLSHISDNFQMMTCSQSLSALIVSYSKHNRENNRPKTQIAMRAIDYFITGRQKPKWGQELMHCSTRKYLWCPMRCLSPRKSAFITSIRGRAIRRTWRCHQPWWLSHKIISRRTRTELLPLKWALFHGHPLETQ